MPIQVTYHEVVARERQKTLNIMTREKILKAFYGSNVTFPRVTWMKSIPLQGGGG